MFAVHTADALADFRTVLVRLFPIGTERQSISPWTTGRIFALDRPASGSSARTSTPR
jgi:hypothetical protein